MNKLLRRRKEKCSHHPRLLLSPPPLGSRWALFARHNNLSSRARCIKAVCVLYIYLLAPLNSRNFIASPCASYPAVISTILCALFPPDTEAVEQHGHYPLLTLKLSKHQPVLLSWNSSIMWKGCTNSSLTHSHQEQMVLILMLVVVLVLVLVLVLKPPELVPVPGPEVILVLKPVLVLHSSYTALLHQERGLQASFPPILIRNK